MALLGGLSHPHITTLYAALPDMVEEAGGGADLATLLTSGRLTGEWGEGEGGGGGGSRPWGIECDYLTSSYSHGRCATLSVPPWEMQGPYLQRMSRVPLQQACTPQQLTRPQYRHWRHMFV
jgi:hypothetical protein